MKLLETLREYLAPNVRASLREEPLCSCGDSNHVRMVMFRVGGLPAVFIIPEAASLTAVQAEESLGNIRVETLTEPELESIYAESDLGRGQPFSNPFGTAVYLDQSLLLYPALVFCPHMFGGREGECFRVPTRDLLALTQANVLPLVPEPCTASDWAV